MDSLCFDLSFYSEAVAAPRLDIQLMSKFTDHNCTVWRVSWNLTGTILSSSGDDGYVRMWKSEFIQLIDAKVCSIHLIQFSFFEIQWTIWSNGNALQYSNRMAHNRHMINRWMRPLQRPALHWPPRNTTNAAISAIQTKFCCTEYTSMILYVYPSTRVKNDDFVWTDGSQSQSNEK